MKKTLRYTCLMPRTNHTQYTHTKKNVQIIPAMTEQIKSIMSEGDKTIAKQPTQMKFKIASPHRFCLLRFVFSSFFFAWIYLGVSFIAVLFIIYCYTLLKHVAQLNWFGFGAVVCAVCLALDSTEPNFAFFILMMRLFFSKV